MQLYTPPPRPKPPSTASETPHPPLKWAPGEHMHRIYWGALLGLASASAFAAQTRTTHVHGPEEFTVGREVCASFANNDLRVSQVLSEHDVREYVTRLENGGQTYSYIFNAFCDPAAPFRNLMEGAFLCCPMRPQRSAAANPSLAATHVKSGR